MQSAPRTISVSEVILARQSIRRFKPDAVPQSALREILELARRTPSWSNVQPWEVAVATGRALDAIKEAHAANFEASVPQHADVPWPEFSDRFIQRRRENGLRLFGLLGIGRDDAEKLKGHRLTMQRFFDAPVGLVFYFDRSLGPWSFLDLGAFMQTIMLAACELGLGTCPLAAVSYYPEVLRGILAIPDTKQIVCGMGVGYAVEDSPVNQFRSNRVPLEEFVTWHGFE